MILNGKKCMKTRFFSNIECHIVIGLCVKHHKDIFILKNQAKKIVTGSLTDFQFKKLMKSFLFPFPI